MKQCSYEKQVEKWGMLEISLEGKTEGNPFTDYGIQGTFTGKQERVTVDGFYDGNGIYKVRFMPSFEGKYTLTVTGSAIDGLSYTGEFLVTDLVRIITVLCGWSILIILPMRMEHPTTPLERPAMCGICKVMNELPRRWKP